jgi:tetratricopeptide (TPR) repeat protein
MRRSAADLLSLMSFFDRQGIPEWLLKPECGASDQRKSVSDEIEDMESNSSAGEAEDVFDDDVSMLRDYCLITPNQDGDEFEMHGLVQLSTRRWLEASRRQEEFKQQFITRLSGSYPTGDYRNWGICRRLFAHVEKATDYRPASNTVEEVWATLLYNGGWYAWLQGMYEVAERMAGKARRSRERRLGREALDTLCSISMLASIVLSRGLWKEAEKLFVQVMETRKTKLGAGHPDTLTSMANLASTYWNQGRWDEAEKLEVQVMETSTTKLGADHPDTLTSMANLASTYRNQGRWDEAEKLFVQVIETSTTKLGAGHPDTLTSMAHLASTCREQGRWDKAEKLNVQVMETRKTKLGADHPDTLSVRIFGFGRFTPTSRRAPFPTRRKRGSWWSSATPAARLETSFWESTSQLGHLRVMEGTTLRRHSMASKRRYELSYEICMKRSDTRRQCAVFSGHYQSMKRFAEPCQNCSTGYMIVWLCLGVSVLQFWYVSLWI